MIVFQSYGGFLKWWCPTKNDHFGVFWGYRHLRKHPYPKEVFKKTCLMYTVLLIDLTKDLLFRRMIRVEAKIYLYEMCFFSFP